ncbi:MAG: hypothetical protein JWN44_1721 [Myxococcales bacterium]|nr:hypothetical protein [Myxococcales bacterium]
MREPAGLCTGCGLSGFADATMSFSETGLVCQSCYFKWELAQREQALEAERAASRAVHRSHRWRLVAIGAVGLIMVIVSR